MTKPMPNPPMRGPEVLEEVDYFLECQVHPLMIAQELHRTPGSIYMLARRYQRRDLMETFADYLHENRRKGAAA